MNLKKHLLILSIFCCQIFIGIFGGVLMTDAVTGQIIPTGTVIAGIDIGGLTKAQAKTKLTKNVVNELKYENLVLKAEEKTFTVPLNRINAQYDIEGTIDDVLNTKKGNHIVGEAFVNFKSNLVSKSNSGAFESIPLKIKYDEMLLRKMLENFAHEIEMKAFDAYGEKIDDEIRVNPETIGKRLNIPESLTIIRKHIDTASIITLKVEEVFPSITAADFYGIDGKIAQFTTVIPEHNRENTDYIQHWPQMP
ncbi:MAG: hypothetical protein PWQ70_1773 [Clostridiales bacterium]|nr:hypothetical protein [Clostridiales bacterium]